MFLFFFTFSSATTLQPEEIEYKIEQCHKFMESLPVNNMYLALTTYELLNDISIVATIIRKTDTLLILYVN